MELQAHKGCHGNDGDALRQSSWEGVMPKSVHSGASSKKGGDAIEADEVGTGGLMPKSMPKSSRLSTEAQLDLPNPATRQGQKARVDASMLPIPSVQGRGSQPCGCAGQRSRSQRRCG